MDVLKFLEKEVARKKHLEDLVNAFEKMCQLPIDHVSDEQNMILFETGTYSFTGKPFFYFSMVRQFPNSEEEYDQLHLDVLYSPSEVTRLFERAVWDFEITGSIFECIRESTEYLTLKDMKIKKIDVYMDET